MTSFSVSFPRIQKIPDPASIVTTSDWYFLDQVSDSLFKWDHTSGKYIQTISNKWTFNDASLEINLNESAKFSDGSKITSKDVAASIKRHLIRKTATHFKPWELLLDCEKVTDMHDDCKGISIINEHKIIFNLKRKTESFFLFLASPEGGIWSYQDLENSKDFNPTRFSGSYSMNHNHNTNQLELDKNIFWSLHSHFLHRAEKIICFSEHGNDLKKLIQANKIDLFIETIMPFSTDWIKENPNLNHVKSAFNTLIYLYKVKDDSNKINVHNMNTMWSSEYNSDFAPANTFLPYSSLSGVTKNEILQLLPKESSNKIRIGVLSGYFNNNFINFLFSKIENIEIVNLTFEDWSNSYTKEYNKNKLDFVLTPYVASERFPSVQVNFLLEWRQPPFSLEILDSPENTFEKKETLTKIQKWLVKTQIVIPLVFIRNHIVYSKKINIGEQPLTDSEIQLWRVLVPDSIEVSSSIGNKI